MPDFDKFFNFIWRCFASDALFNERVRISVVHEVIFHTAPLQKRGQKCPLVVYP